jgi:hypothetical protein
MIMIVRQTETLQFGTIRQCAGSMHFHGGMEHECERIVHELCATINTYIKFDQSITTLTIHY